MLETVMLTKKDGSFWSIVTFDIVIKVSINC